MDIKYLGDYSIGFENENGRKNLIIEISLSKDTVIYDYQVEMLEFNRTAGILPVELRRSDNRLKLIYDITGLMTLQYYTVLSKPHFTELSATFGSVLSIIRDSKKLLLYESNFLLDEDFIFVEDSSIKLIYIPVQTSMDFGGMFRDMVIKLLARAGGEINEKALGDIIRCVKSPEFRLTELNTLFAFNKKDLFTPSEVEEPIIQVQKAMPGANEKKQFDFKAVTNSKTKLIALFEIFIISFAFFLNYILGEFSVEAETGYIAAAMIVVVGNLLLYKKVSSIKPPKEKKAPDISIKNKKENPKSKYNTDEVKLTVTEETTILKPDSNSAYLIETGKSPPEYTEIKGTSFIIGRSPSIADMVIDDNAVGRIHAEIIKRDNDYYIVDKSSKNGTYLNDVRLDAFEHKLESNYLIIFANREYKFMADNISC